MPSITQKFFKSDAFKGKEFAVLTSGGDSQGVNAAIRVVVRMGIYLGCKVYFIRDGFQGMIDGGDNIVEANWHSVSNILYRGGTIIGSAKCSDFRTREGRLKAAHNLVIKEITNLIVIGGDGSLTGANLFDQEWTSLLNELLENKIITKEKRENFRLLHIAGIVGSIDNDFCGTDMAIGTDSALHRIIEAIDALVSTTHSHQRTFVMEITGRNCGYLAISAAIASEADFIFIPEDPVDCHWQNHLCNKLLQKRSTCHRSNIIIVAEGAIDRNGTPVTAEDVKKIVVDKLQEDVHITVLGHLQRSGNSSAFDRVLGCRMGAQAVVALMEATEYSVACVVSLVGNKIVRVPLMECVERTKAVAKAMANKNWELAVKLRGLSFQKSLEIYKMLTHLKPPKKSVDAEVNGIEGYTLAVMHIGVPACGMNAAVRSFVRNCIYRGDTVFGIHDGVEGLICGNIKKMDWSDVTGWVSQSGAFLGTKCTYLKDEFKEIAARLKEYKIQGLLIIGGFEAYHTCGQLLDQRSEYPEFCIPLVVIPSAISNNVPGTDFSLGCDSSLNDITKMCDKIRQFAQRTKRHVFVFEIIGGYCGYLATLSGLAGGADAAYIYEEKFSIKDLQQDVYCMEFKMAEVLQNGLILRNEKASKNYDTNFFCKLYSEEAKGSFSCSMHILSDLHQGDSPTPFDRNMGTKMAAKCSDWLADQLKKNTKPDGTIHCDSDDSACLLGLVRRQYHFTPLRQLMPKTNFVQRIPKNQWWLKLRSLLKILAKHNDSTYEDEGVCSTLEECQDDAVVV